MEIFEPAKARGRCMIGVVANGQSLRQRAGRLSAERDNCRKRTGGSGIMGDRVKVGVTTGERMPVGLPHRVAA